jgi:hypothetical protein
MSECKDPILTVVESREHILADKSNFISTNAAHLFEPSGQPKIHQMPVIKRFRYLKQIHFQHGLYLFGRVSGFSFKIIEGIFASTYAFVLAIFYIRNCFVGFPCFLFYSILSNLISVSLALN